MGHQTFLGVNRISHLGLKAFFLKLSLEAFAPPVSLSGCSYCRTEVWPGVGLPRVMCSVWGFDLVQERFHNMSPGDYEGVFIKVGESKARKGLA